MPPSRRRSGRTAPATLSNSPFTSSQSTLTFGSKSRVTKSTAAAPSIDEKTKTRAKDLSAASVAVVEEPQPHIAEAVVREQAETEAQQPLSEEDERALKITRKELQRYWNNEEARRKAARVHQQDLTLEEKILRHFDLSSQYGPCVGIARLKRWRRAKTLDLDPPIEVLAVLLKDEGDTKQRAYVDELMS